MHYFFEIIDAYSKHSNVLFSLTVKQENPQCFTPITRVMRCFSSVVLFSQQHDSNNDFFVCTQTFFSTELLVHCMGVPRQQPHRRSGLATLPSVGAVP